MLKSCLKFLKDRVIPKTSPTSIPATYSDPIVNRELITKYMIYIREIEKLRQLKDVDIRKVLPLILYPCMNVIDIGGECGSSFYVIKKLDSNREIDNYAVVESPNFVKEINSIQPQVMNDIIFFSEVKSARIHMSNVDCVLLNSSLQYFENPEQIIDEIKLIEPRYVYLTKTPFLVEEGNRNSFQESILSNNGPVSGLFTLEKDIAVRNPVSILNKSYFEKLWSDYDVVVHGECSEIFYFNGREKCKTYFYLLEKRINREE